jgi:DNA-binding beta-propeller fold protein YncE
MKTSMFLQEEPNTGATPGCPGAELVARLCGGRWLAVATLACLLALTWRLRADNPPALAFTIESAGVPGGLGGPSGVAVDARLNIYVVDSGNGRVVKFGRNGGYLTQWASAGTLGIAVDSNTNVYVAGGSSTVYKYTSSGALLTSWDIGFPPYLFFVASYVAVDNANNVYVSCGNGTYGAVREFSSSGAIVNTFSATGGPFPFGIGLDKNHDVYAAYGTSVIEFANSGAVLTHWDAAARAGVAVDTNSNVYLVASTNVQKYSSSGVLLSQWAGIAPGATGYGIAVDASGNYVYVADASNDRISVFTYTPANPPIATTLAASAITTNTATLNATVNPNSLPASAWFRWGTTTNYGNLTAATNLGAGTLVVPVATALGGLAPGTTYHFSITAANSQSVAYGADLSFTTRDVSRTITAAAVLSQGQFQLQFSGGANVLYSVLGSTNPALPLSNWTVLGPATQTAPGVFQFTDLAATNGLGFYSLRTP